MTQVTLREYLQNIEDALTAEQVNDALSKCQYVQAQFPDALEVQRLLGETYLKQGMMQEAQQSFDWVLTNDPENVVVYCDRALMSERMTDYETALDCYQQAYELSRGNSTIRQQFNMLSSRTGQQGFMLSRAGLARLYMRGDLLSQAAQEWELVLSAAPERLDARTGLLETYWREGLDERVEQLAHQILRDIPECLKALLLLAHVTAPRDMQQARELIQRAEVLDPDLVMARELFGDAIAAQPGHPFWKLVNKTPVVIGTTSSEKQVEPIGLAQQYAATPAKREQVLVPDALTRVSSSDSSSDWNELEEWQTMNASPYSPQQESPSRELYASLMGQEDLTDTAFDPEAIEDRPTMEVQLQHQEQPVSQNGTALNVMNAEWMHTNVGQESASPEQENVWASSLQSEGESQGSVASPPAWLSMLTQDDQPVQHEQPQQTQQLQQLIDASIMNEPSTSSGSNIMASDSAGVPDESQDEWRQVLQNSLNQAVKGDGEENEDEDESFFGPEWLKSLGAASIDMEAQPEKAENVHLEEAGIPAVVMPTASAPVEKIPQAVTPSVTEPEATPAIADPYEWIHSLATAATSSTLSEQEEQNLLTTLEGLEQDLRTQGFIPLEPRTLSTIAQSQALSDAPAESELEFSQDAEQKWVQEPAYESGQLNLDDASWGEQSEQDALLSSVLAQLGNYSETPQPAQKEYQSSSSLEPLAESMQVPVEQVQQSIVEPNTTTPVEAPLWPATLPVVPSSTSATSVTSHGVANISAIEETSVSSAPDTLKMREEAPAQEKLELPSQLSYAMPVEQKREVQPSLPVPVAQSEREKLAASFNQVFADDLEVTMKRPAVRLQPVQQARKPQSLSYTSSAQKERVERVERGQLHPVSRSDGGSSNQERLRRGYQHQLVGDYDEAMQEYRVIIRNAPELLGDVVSNVRALLKLAPKYSAGYRVLGDAYMRQGEYLQAMDAYNQALAITKKARV